MCLLDAAGVGVSHCLGVGGRDLSAAVGGRSTRQALPRSPPTRTPRPDRGLQAPGRRRARRPARRMPPSLGTAGALGAARDRVARTSPRPSSAFLEAEGHPVPAWPATLVTAGGPVTGRGPSLRGLFCGGTLADEAMLVAEATLGGIRSNIPFSPGVGSAPTCRTADTSSSTSATTRYTRGPRPPDDRPVPADCARIAARGRRPDLRACCCSTSCSATARTPTRPASSRPPSVGPRRDARRRARPSVVSLLGTDGDPQDRRGSAETLRRRRRLDVLSNATPPTPARRSPRPVMRRDCDTALVRRPLRGLLDADRGRRGRRRCRSSPTRCARRPSPSPSVDWQPPAAATRTRPRPRHGRPASQRGQRRWRCERMLDAPGPTLVDVDRPARRSAWSAGTFLPRGPADRLGAGHAARCAGARRGDAARGARRHRPRRPPAAPPAAGGVSILEPCHAPRRRRADGRGDQAQSMWVCVAARRVHGNRRGARSTRGWARCCATAPTGPTCSTGWTGCVGSSARSWARPCGLRGDRPAGDHRPGCRWATSATIAIAPARELLIKALARA